MVFKKLGITSDHAGKALRKDLCELLMKLDLEVHDLGVAYDDQNSVDYPYFGSKLAKLISTKELDGGIAICGTGIGMSIVANKFQNVRATTVWDQYSTQMSRQHNNCNCLCLGARVLDKDLAIQLTKIWLNTEFQDDRHKKRVNLITEIEKENFK